MCHIEANKNEYFVRAERARTVETVTSAMNARSGELRYAVPPIGKKEEMPSKMKWLNC